MAYEKKNAVQVSVIIVNYNTVELLRQCLNSLFSKTEDISYEVIVVDNDSKDGSVSMLSEEFPKVITIEAGGNLGFGRANNLGAKSANGKYLFLLNSDTIIRNNVLRLFYDYMEEHTSEKLGAIGCWLVDGNGKPNRSYGWFPTIKTEIDYILGKIKERIGRQGKELCDKEQDVDYITGADLFVRADIYRQLNGFDSHFFMYYEETDLQYRMKEMGYSRRVIGGPDIIHLDGGSFDNKGLTPRRFEMSQRSFNYYAQKNYNLPYWILFRLFIILWRSTMLFSINHWPFRERWKAYQIVLSNKQ